MSVEQRVNAVLQAHPKTKAVVKRAYQSVMSAVGPQDKVLGPVRRITPDDGREWLYGYYDKSPWDADGKYFLACAVDDATAAPASDTPMSICLIDTDSGDVKEIATSRCWNTQQGCMAQWLGPDFASRIIYNDFRKERFCSVILDVREMIEIRVLPRPIYEVSHDGTFALTLDFLRLNTLRPGYGYKNLPDKTAGVTLPEGPCVTRIDLSTGDMRDILTYESLFAFEHRPEMDGAFHKVNHIMLRPNDSRMMLMHRWMRGGKKWSRLVTVNCDGSDLYNLSDDDFVSHCFWKSEDEIISFLNKNKSGRHYYVLHDRSEHIRMLWPDIDYDGHPSCSPDRTLILTDCYPDKRRMQSVLVGNEWGYERLCSVFSPFKYEGDVRCDLHPRWRRDGRSVCFDAAFEGRRAVYVIDKLGEVFNKKPIDVGIRLTEKPLISVIVPVYNVGPYLRKCIDSILCQTYDNLEIILVDDGSTDGSGGICDEYAVSDDRVIVIHRENGGLSAARNSGLAIASGSYVGFVDSDDWLDCRMYEQLMWLVIRYEADAAQCGFVRTDDEEASSTSSDAVCTYYDKDILQHFMYQGMSGTGGYSVWRCLFKAKSISGLEFRVGKINEDMDFKYRALELCHTFAETEENLYFWRKGEESISQGGLKARDFDMFDSALELVELSRNEDYGSIRELAIDKLARVPFTLLSKVAYYGVSDSSINEDRLVRILQESLRHSWPVLMHSPMPVNRKILATMYCGDFRIAKACVRLARRAGA